MGSIPNGSAPLQACARLIFILRYRAAPEGASFQCLPKIIMDHTPVICRPKVLIGMHVHCVACCYGNFMDKTVFAETLEISNKPVLSTVLHESPTYVHN